MESIKNKYAITLKFVGQCKNTETNLRSLKVLDFDRYKFSNDILLDIVLDKLDPEDIDLQIVLKITDFTPSRKTIKYSI